MAKIYIALVGGQTAPVGNGIMMTAPDKVVYIYSEESKETVAQLRSQFPVDEDMEPVLDAIDMDNIKQRVRELSERYKDDKVILNISGGPKSWAYLFGVHFEKCPNAEVIYIDQNSTLWNYTTGKHETGCPFDMHFLLKLYGNTLRDTVKVSDYTEADIECLKKIEEIRSFSIPEFNSLATVLSKEQSSILKTLQFGKFTTPAGSYIEWEKKSADKDAFVRISLKNKKGTVKTIQAECPHAIGLAFNSGWFEFKVARMLSQWNETKEIYLNCIFPFSQHIDKNEVDIIVQTENKLLFVECKTKITNNTDIDKFRSVVKGYGGTASKALFITDAPMSLIEKEKCDQFGILHFSLQDQHLGMDSETALKLLLDNDIHRSNIR